MGVVSVNVVSEVGQKLSVVASQMATPFLRQGVPPNAALPTAFVRTIITTVADRAIPLTRMHFLVADLTADSAIKSQGGVRHPHSL